MYKIYEEYLATLHNAGKYRRLGRTCQEHKLEMLDFSSNDYLNLSCHRDVIAAAQAATEKYGAGSTGSRLLSGNCELYEEFERVIAKDKSEEACLIFSSGFQANISVLSCLLDEKIFHQRPLVFFDKLNHSSLYQAIFLSKVEFKRYHHNDVNHLESLLKIYENDSRQKFIVTETVFGMDGDVAPLKEIIELARKFNSFLYLDEAHATGVFGKNGYGLSTCFDLRDIAHITMGTFSKAIGVSGAYIASNNILRDFILNKATGFVYSTAPSPAVIGAAFEAWKLVRYLNKEREYLQELGETLRKMLRDLGFNLGTCETHIITIILHKEDECLKIQKALFEEFIIVSCVRPPTVPSGTARLRIAVTAKHSYEDIKKLVQTLAKLVKI